MKKWVLILVAGMFVLGCAERKQDLTSAKRKRNAEQNIDGGDERKVGRRYKKTTTRPSDLPVERKKSRKEENCPK